MRARQQSARARRTGSTREHRNGVRSVVSVSVARRRLLEAITALANITGEANWTQGYRALYESRTANEVEALRLRQKESDQWHAVGVATTKMEGALKVYTAAVRREK